MARKAKRKHDREKAPVDDMPRLYKFFLNPYQDVRFTAFCPGCCGKTRQRKLPLAIHVYGGGMVLLNKTCRFCPYCELLIAHRDEIESQLTFLFGQTAPQLIGSDYLVVGTVERKHWSRGRTKPLTNTEMLNALRVFEDQLDYRPPPQWVHAGSPDQASKPR